MKQIMLSQSGEVSNITLPASFLQNGWNLFLPKGTISIMLSVMTYILQGYSKAEILELMIMEEEELSLTPFNFTVPFTYKTEEEKQVYLTISRQEKRIYKVLERSGYTYPKTIQEWVELLIELKIIQEVIREEKIFLDIVIEPFPHPKEVLTLTTDELKKLDKYQINQHIESLSEV
ncbi:DUF6042 family protein [Thermoflavimicrobium daqui]|uniref:Uncharacterized protein n=1 Tax=Thermoflavimicrobium daqui TaxID=2137476 RepID=A0A364K6K3_9BACL|nr:DUF6042 family protein [Thermoflavimicrobium daqui]RAL25908.1 hypothetical protein DL897_07480 [Thermoflavimicrobium daqui]